ncbi:hypothetical protein C8J57DRAFT_1507234 [Mycena rebaudengoi]|nr:hypothetical protein C8J57DRAFT_1507234 [Mycena rebaudengoi]
MSFPFLATTWLQNAIEKRCHQYHTSPFLLRLFTNYSPAPTPHRLPPDRPPQTVYRHYESVAHQTAYCERTNVGVAHRHQEGIYRTPDDAGYPHSVDSADDAVYQAGGAGTTATVGREAGEEEDDAILAALWDEKAPPHTCSFSIAAQLATNTLAQIDINHSPPRHVPHLQPAPVRVGEREKHGARADDRKIGRLPADKSQTRPRPRSGRPAARGEENEVMERVGRTGLACLLRALVSAPRLLWPWVGVVDGCARMVAGVRACFLFIFLGAVEWALWHRRLDVDIGVGARRNVDFLLPSFRFRPGTQSRLALAAPMCLQVWPNRSAVPAHARCPRIPPSYRDDVRGSCRPVQRVPAVRRGLRRGGWILCGRDEMQTGRRNGHADSGARCAFARHRAGACMPAVYMPTGETLHFQTIACSSLVPDVAYYSLRPMNRPRFADDPEKLTEPVRSRSSVCTYRPNAGARRADFSSLAGSAIPESPLVAQSG